VTGLAVEEKRLSFRTKEVGCGAVASGPTRAVL